MPDAIKLNVGAETVRTFAVQLKAYHAKTMPSGQNDSGDLSEGAHAGLELSGQGGELADLRGTYGELDASERLDLAALLLLGLGEADSFSGAMAAARDRSGPDLDAMRQMPLSADLLLDGLDQVDSSAPNVTAVRAPLG